MVTAPVYTRPVAVPATALTAGDRFLARRVIDALAPPDGPGDLIVAADRMEPFDDMAMVVELDTGQVLEVDSIVWARLASEPPAPPPRATFLQLADVRVLDMWGAELRLMFDHTAYLVGSCLLRPDYRDVDVRVIVPTDTFDLFASVVDVGRLNVALSIWGAHVTGLPIDCQLQSVDAGADETGPIRPVGRVPGRLDGEAWPT